MLSAGVACRGDAGATRSAGRVAGMSARAVPAAAGETYSDLMRFTPFGFGFIRLYPKNLGNSLGYVYKSRSRI